MFNLLKNTFGFTQVYRKVEIKYLHYFESLFCIFIYAISSIFINEKLQINPMLPPIIIVIYNFFIMLAGILFETVMISLFTKLFGGKMKIKNIISTYIVMLGLFNSLHDILYLVCLKFDINVILIILELIFILIKTFVFYRCLNLFTTVKKNAPFYAVAIFYGISFIVTCFIMQG